jgi:DUF971 family protein
MQPTDMQVVGDELAVKWADGSETYVRLERLRRACPCAGCKGEVDVMGNVHGGGGAAGPLGPAALRVSRLTPVGGYGVQPVWGDGHAAGIFGFDYLRRLGAAPACLPTAVKTAGGLGPESL